MSITAVNLNAAKFFVGPDLVRLRGAADDYFTIAKISDVGAMQAGIGGDMMLVTRAQFGHMGTLTLLQASAAVGVLLLVLRGEALLLLEEESAAAVAVSDGRRQRRR